MINDKWMIQKGQVIVELLVAFGLAAILIPALLTGLIASRNGRVSQEQRIQAVGLLREGEEAVRSLRDTSWDKVKNNGTYYPKISGSTWDWGTQDPDGTIGDFTRSILIEDIDPVDPSLKKITISVNWGGSFLPSTLSSVLYLARWKNTSLADGGTVQPEGQGFGDWCKPSPSATYVNLDRQGHATTVKAFESSDGTGNKILTGTGANASGPAFTNIIIRGNSSPTLISSTDYNGPPSIKVNGVFGNTSDTNYAYLATDHQGVVILNIGTAPYQKIGLFNPTSGNVQSQSVYVVGNTGYLVTDNKFYIFSISADRTTTSQIGSLDLSGGVKVVVDPSSLYAYIANSDPNGELKIVDVHSHPSNLTSADVKNVNVDGGGAGRDVFINASATRAYLVTAANLSDITKPEFFIIDITDPTNPSVFTNNATYNTNGMDPQGITIVTGDRAIIVGTGGNEYQVFTVINDQVGFCPNHDQNNDFLNIDSGVYGISSVFQTDQHAYSYIVTGDASSELEIVEGGPGGNGGPGSNGMFESETLPIPDPGHDVAFNSFTGTVDPDLSYKISIKPGVGGSCSGVTFSDSDFMSIISGPLPLGTIGSGYTNPGECMRYRVYDSGSSSKPFTVTFNYSP